MCGGRVKYFFGEIILQGKMYTCRFLDTLSCTSLVSLPWSLPLFTAKFYRRKTKKKTLFLSSFPVYYTHSLACLLFGCGFESNKKSGNCVVSKQEWCGMYGKTDDVGVCVCNCGGDAAASVIIIREEESRAVVFIDQVFWELNGEAEKRRTRRMLELLVVISWLCLNRKEERIYIICRAFLTVPICPILIIWYKVVYVVHCKIVK